MADLYPEIEAAMEPIRELHARNRMLRPVRDALWARRPWKWTPLFMRRRVFAWYVTRHFDG